MFCGLTAPAHTPYSIIAVEVTQDELRLYIIRIRSLGKASNTFRRQFMLAAVTMALRWLSVNKGDVANVVSCPCKIDEIKIATAP